MKTGTEKNNVNLLAQRLASPRYGVFGKPNTEINESASTINNKEVKITRRLHTAADVLQQ